MDSVNSSIIRGIFSVISFIFSLIIAVLVTLTVFGYKIEIPAWLLIIHALLVVVTISANTNYRYKIQEACNSFFRPLPQVFQLIIIAPISIIGGFMITIVLITLAIKVLNSYTKALSYGEQIDKDLGPNFIRKDVKGH